MLWRHLFGYLPASLTSGLASFAAVFVFTRLLGAADYGRYALALTSMNLVYSLCATWAEASGFRFASQAQTRGELPIHIRTALAAGLASACVASSCLLIGMTLTQDAGLRLALALAAAVLILMPILNLSQEISRATHAVQRYAAVKMAQDIGAFVIGSALAWRAGLGPASPFAGSLCVLVLLAVTEGSRLMRMSKGGHIDRTRLSTFFAFGFPVAIALLLHLALDAGDRFLIAAYLGPEAVGIYAAGYGVADKTVGLLCTWAAAASAPLMLAAWERGGQTALTEASSRTAAAFALIAAPAATGLALVATPLSEIMIAESMREQAAQIMPWIALSGLLAGFALHYAAEAFQLSKRNDLRALMMVPPVLLNLGLNVLLLPRVGLMGAVYATLASYALALVLLAVVGRKQAKLSWPLDAFARVGLACAAMAPAVLAVPHLGGLPELVLKAGIGACVYMLAILILDAGGVRTQLRARLFPSVREA
jgi:O-antigen/teichoic acid export membrane protein